MANQFLKLRRSSVPGKVPDTGSLDYGEIALNTYDGLAFMKKSGSNGEEVVTIGSKSGSFYGSFTGSLQGTASWAEQALTASSADNFTVRGTLTAQTLVVQVITSSTELITGSLTVSGALNALGGITGSFSGSLYNLQGTPTYIPFFSASQILADSAMFQVYDGSGVYSIAINENAVDSSNPEALFVSQTSTSSFNVITGKGNLNNYLQLNIKNTNQGTNASSDVVATANNGNEFTNYVNMGINSQNYSGFLGGPNDAYLFATGSEFHIGNITPNKHLGFFVGGGDVDAGNKFALYPDNQHQMSGSLDVSGSVTAFDFTGSLFGTASWAENVLSSSFALNAGTLDGTGSAIFATTGSNVFKGLQTIHGNLFMSGSFPLIYNNDSTNNMLFGMFDGSTISGPYYQLFGNQYPNIAQRGGAEFIYDIRNNPNADFHIASFDGSSWTTKLVVNDNGTQITGSLGVTGGITGSLYGTSSWAENALTASYVNGLELFRIITGSIVTSVDVIPENLFLIKSGSVTYLNISSSGDTEIYSNKFEVRNFTTKQPVLTVSQSVVQFQTQSSDPVGPTNAGSIWFTATAMYVGLE